MNISISNYRNIGQLGLEIEEGKVNYLFGICGSGKTSILDAVRRRPTSADTRIGSGATEPEVTINGSSPLYESTHIYSLEQQEVLFSKGPTADCYRVFVGDETELVALEASFNESIDKLRQIRDKLIIFKGKVEQLEKIVGKPTKTGYTARSRLGKAQSAMASAAPNPESVVGSGDIAYVEWRSRGFGISGSYESGICPFCRQLIPDKTKRNLDELRVLSAKELKPALEAAALLPELGIQEPDYANEAEFERLKQDLLDTFKARDAISKVIDYTYVGRGTALLHGMPDELNIDPVAYRFLPELEPLVLDAKKRRSELTSQIGKMRGAMQRLVGSSSIQLNGQLKMLGIPYEFEVERTDREQHTASYVLRHTGFGSEKDMRDCLSYGEKNLVALILFLQSDNSELTLIDDPASSYDDFRRSQIYDCIMKHRGKTVLVVSHDQAFVRRAVCDRDRKRLGKILFLENRPDRCLVTELTKGSFVFLDSEIRRRIADASTYFQKLINVRLYCEIHKEEVGSTIWGYTSAILHGNSRSEVTSLLAERGASEQDVLDDLKARSEIDFDPMPLTVNRAVTDAFTEFEVLIFAREMLSAKKEAGLSFSPDEKLWHDMLNDLVHMNDCALFCLNPYRYMTWPSMFSNRIVQCRAMQLGSE